MLCHAASSAYGKVISRYLLHGELCGRVGIEALIGNGLSAANRTAVGALGQSLQGTIERGQPVAQAGRDGCAV